MFLLSLSLGACVHTQKSKNPIVGKWTTSSCSNAITLQSNHQVQGSVYGNWEEREHIVELNLAKNIKGQRQYIQVLLAKPNQEKVKVLRVIYPFGTWQGGYKSGDILRKCR